MQQVPLEHTPEGVLLRSRRIGRAASDGPATLIRLTADSGAAGHSGGVGQRVWEAAVYDWINRVIANGATPTAAQPAIKRDFQRVGVGQETMARGSWPH
jgi:hypothetical protein